MRGIPKAARCVAARKKGDVEVEVHSCLQGERSLFPGTPLDPLMILLVDVTMQNNSGYEYMGLVPSEHRAALGWRTCAGPVHTLSKKACYDYPSLSW